jgi:hypothetical protein
LKLKPLEIASLAGYDQSTGAGIQAFNRDVFGDDLWDEQIRWALSATKDINLLSPGNGWGKTEFLARDAIRRAFYKIDLVSKPFWWVHDPQEWLMRDWRGLTAAFDHDTGQESFNRLKLRYDRGEPVRQLIKELHRSEPPDIKLINDAILDWGTLAEGGKHVEAIRRQLVQVDEVGHEPNYADIHDDVLFPRTLGVNGIMLLYGTPKPKTDPYVYEMYEQGQDPEHPVYFSMSGDASRNPYWPESDRQRILRNPRYVLPDGTFTPKGLQVVRGHFINTGGRFFKRTSVIQLFSGDYDFYETKDKPAGTVFNSWDLGGSRPKSDATVGLVADTSEWPYRIAEVHWYPKDEITWSQKYDTIEEVAERTGAQAIAIDVTGALSDAVEEELVERGLPVEAFRLGGTSGTKFNLLRGLQTRLEEARDVNGRKVIGAWRYPRTITHPELDPRRKEFVDYRYPDDKGLTTDTVMAHAMLDKMVDDLAVPPPMFGQKY